MTTRRKRRKNQHKTLKTFLTVGSLAATLAGTRLLAAQDTTAVDTAVPTDSTITVVVPTDNGSIAVLPLPPNSRGTQIQLQQIPQVVQPQIRPIARSHSSR